MQEVRRDEGLEPWPRLRDLVVEFSEEEPMEGRRGSVVDLRCTLGRFSDSGRGFVMSVDRVLEGESEVVFLGFLGRVGAVLLLWTGYLSVLVSVDFT